MHKPAQPQDFNATQCFGITFPLLTDKSGKKFGKSESGALWLDSTLLSPYQLYQAMYRLEDADVGKFLYMLTDVDAEVVGELAR